MADDGRTFFYTQDALVPQDTNGLHDVYEYVDGRPQLITSGTGSEDTLTTEDHQRSAGLASVGANGVNVFFYTYETLVGQDTNGPLLKVYDARTDGGFSYQPPPAPCEAADECHGPGSSPPEIPPTATQATLAGGNADPVPHARRGSGHRRPAGHNRRHARHNRRAAH